MKVKSLNESIEWTPDSLFDLRKNPFRVISRDYNEVVLQYHPDRRYGTGTFEIGFYITNSNCLVVIRGDYYGDKWEHSKVIRFDQVSDASKINKLCFKIEDLIDNTLESISNLTPIELLFNHLNLLSIKTKFGNSMDKLLIK